ncbi:hypothetical protein GQE99_06595 [Maritimibacter sp. DP07]|uniref:Uncharacterized protein n=1 Tax=Maritimibacter harenae TaxID=2606218 RepID=A0A845M2W8_9RHOB|nr:hypothetical protein [Maritimibacter harenae]MZR12688.1 hypothetical protein [Maritimibacter harenae]
MTQRKFYIVFSTSTLAESPEEAAQIGLEQVKNGEPYVEVFEGEDGDAVLEYNMATGIFAANRGPGAGVTLTVMLHGFIRLDDDGNPDPSGLAIEHEDYDSDDCHGWNVWVRRDWETPNVHGETFDSWDEFEGDFQTLKAAELYAEALAANLGAEIDMY